ncbi:MAG: DUF6457 domain-containing protein [Aeromicrobium sp.]
MAEISLEDWTASVAAELGISADLDFDVEQILQLAAVAAHNVVRPAAPLTTFLAGFAAAQAGGSNEDLAQALATATAFCDRAGDAAT